jgi:hypothetical protein
MPNKKYLIESIVSKSKIVRIKTKERLSGKECAKSKDRSDDEQGYINFTRIHDNAGGTCPK